MKHEAWEICLKANVHEKICITTEDGFNVLHTMLLAAIACHQKVSFVVYSSSIYRIGNVFQEQFLHWLMQDFSLEHILSESIHKTLCKHGCLHK